MFTKALIEEVIDSNKARVRILRFNKTKDAVDGTPFNELYIATISSSFGINPALKVGDIVFVTFEDELQNQPVIVGTFVTPSKETTSDIKADSINVGSAAKLPYDTSIGDITKDEIKNLLNSRANLQGQIDKLVERIEKLEKGE